MKKQRKTPNVPVSEPGTCHDRGTCACQALLWAETELCVRQRPTLTKLCYAPPIDGG